MRNSDDSRIVYPANAFGIFPTIAVALGLLVVFFAVIVFGWILWLVQHGFDQAAMLRAFGGFYGIAVQSVAELLVAGYLLLLVPKIARSTPRDLGFRRATAADWKKVGFGIVAMFLIVSLLASGLSTALHFKSPELAMQVYMQSVGWQKVFFIFFGVVLAPLFEEAVFRFFLFNVMKKWWGFGWGMAISSLLFGLAHSQPPFVPAMFISLTVPLACAGVVLAMVYERTGKAWASVVTHGAFNGVTLLAVVFFPSLAK